MAAYKSGVREADGAVFTLFHSEASGWTVSRRRPGAPAEAPTFYKFRRWNYDSLELAENAFERLVSSERVSGPYYSVRDSWAADGVYATGDAGCSGDAAPGVEGE